MFRGTRKEAMVGGKWGVRRRVMSKFGLRGGEWVSCWCIGVKIGDGVEC